jgi:hypothetical protein
MPSFGILQKLCTMTYPDLIFPFKNGMTHLGSFHVKQHNVVAPPSEYLKVMQVMDIILEHEEIAAFTKNNSGRDCSGGPTTTVASWFARLQRQQYVLPHSDHCHARTVSFV